MNPFINYTSCYVLLDAYNVCWCPLFYNTRRTNAKVVVFNDEVFPNAINYRMAHIISEIEVRVK